MHVMTLHDRVIAYGRLCPSVCPSVCTVGGAHKLR